MKSVEINVNLIQKAENFIELNARQTLCILVKETENTGVYNVRTNRDVEELKLTQANEEFVKRGLGQKTIVIADTTVDLVLEKAAAQKYNYICSNFTDEEDNVKVKEFAIEQIEEYKNPIMPILAHCEADHKNFSNFTTDNIKVAGKTYTAEEYVSRMASVIANVPPTESATYRVLKEIDSVPKLSKGEENRRISNGELILIDDGEKVKIARGVTSLTSLGAATEDMQSIRLVTTENIIKNDIRKSVADRYVGKKVGSYTEKMNICQEIKKYLSILKDQFLIEDNYSADVDVQATKKYLQSIGENVDDMTEDEIRHANTKKKCFILAKVQLLDAMEDFYINIEKI